MNNNLTIRNLFSNVLKSSFFIIAVALFTFALSGFLVSNRAEAATAGDVVINEFHSTVAGTSDLEWLEIKNTTSVAIDLTGWTIKNADTNTTNDLTLSVTIPANGYLTFDHAAGWLRNGGDTVTVSDQNGVTIDTISYGTFGSIPAPDGTQSAYRTSTGSWALTTNMTKGTSNSSTYALSLTGTTGNLGALETVDSNNVLVNGSTPVTDPNYFNLKGYSGVVMDINKAGGPDAYPNAIKVARTFKPDFQVWVYEDQWYNVNELGYGGLGLPLTTFPSIERTLYFVTATPGDYPFNFRLADLTNDSTVATASANIHVAGSGTSTTTSSGPSITINPYPTTPTNQDVTVTATATNGTLNTSSHVFSANGLFDFIATDSNGNTATTTVAITNIDKVAPVVTVSTDVSTSTPTTGNIVASATTNEGTLNFSSHTFSANGSFDFVATDAAGNSTTQHVTISNITAVQNTPNSNGEGNITVTNPTLTVSSSTQALIVSVDGGLTNGALDLSALLSGQHLTLPQITLHSSVAEITIPAGTIATNASSTLSWNGILSMPFQDNVSASTSIPDLSGQTRTLSEAIKFGWNGGMLTFNKAIRILMLGQAGKMAGYMENNGPFVEITNGCAADNQVSADAMASTSTECKIDSGSDLAIWTRHLSTFITFSQTPIVVAPTPAPVSSGGGGGTGVSQGGPVGLIGLVNTNPTFIATTGTPNPFQQTGSNTGVVLGATSYNFTLNLSIGSTGDEVTELQKHLTAEGVYTGPITGYYGTLTAAGVRKFQAKYGISQLGIVGPQTRLRLNSTTNVNLSTNAGMTTTSMFARSLSMGSTGSDVTLLQQKLTNDGVYTGPITGYYGTLTEAAVKKYQDKNGISALGMVGPLTLAILNK